MISYIELAYLNLLAWLSLLLKHHGKKVLGESLQRLTICKIFGITLRKYQFSSSQVDVKTISDPTSTQSYLLSFLGSKANALFSFLLKLERGSGSSLSSPIP